MPKRSDHIVIALYLSCPASHRLGELEIDRDTHSLKLLESGYGRDVAGEPLRYEDGKLRYRCASCVRTTLDHGWPQPPPRAVPWRTVAALAAALACQPEGNLNRTLTATTEHFRDALSALIPDDEPRPDAFATYLADFRDGPNWPNTFRAEPRHVTPGTS